MRTIQATQPSNKRRKITLLLCLVVIFAAGSVAAVLYLQQTNNVPTGKVSGIDYNPPSKEDKQAAEEEKIKKVEDAQQNQTPQQTNQKQAAISSATYDQTSRSVIVKTELRGDTWQTCQLTASKAGSSDVTLTANVLYQPSFSTCMGFSLPADQLDSPGQWTLALTATSAAGGKTTSEPTSVMVNK